METWRLDFSMHGKCIQATSDGDEPKQLADNVSKIRSKLLCLLVGFLVGFL